MAQLERKIGVLDREMRLRDYEMDGLDESDREDGTGEGRVVTTSTTTTSTSTSTKNLTPETPAMLGEGLSSLGSVGKMHHAHRLELGEGVGRRETSSSVRFLLWFLLVVHMSGLFIWFRVWMRERRVKAARTGKMTPPPQRQSCTYDVDSRSFISKMELPLKALKLARA